MKKILILLFTFFMFSFAYANDLTGDVAAKNDATSDVKTAKTKAPLFKKVEKKQVPEVSLISDAKVFYDNLHNYIGMDFAVSLITPDFVVRGMLLKVYDDGLLIQTVFPKKEIFINRTLITCIELKK